MRELILKRIEDIRNTSDNFPISSMRWQHINYNRNDEMIHISDLDFNICTDDHLLYLFERILRNYHKQM